MAQFDVPRNKSGRRSGSGGRSVLERLAVTGCSTSACSDTLHVRAPGIAHGTAIPASTNGSSADVGVHAGLYDGVPNKP